MATSWTCKWCGETITVRHVSELGSKISAHVQNKHPDKIEKSVSGATTGTGFWASTCGGLIALFFIFIVTLVVLIRKIAHR